jgi:hypothetical protein
MAARQFSHNYPPAAGERLKHNQRKAFIKRRQDYSGIEASLNEFSGILSCDINAGEEISSPGKISPF